MLKLYEEEDVAGMPTKRTSDEPEVELTRGAAISGHARSIP